MGVIVVLILGAVYFFDRIAAEKSPPASSPPTTTTEPPKKDDPTSGTSPPAATPPLPTAQAPPSGPAPQGPSQNVVRVTDLRFVVENNIRFAAGTATNVSSKTLKYIEIEIGLLNVDGQPVSSVMINTARESKTFAPGSVWKFRVTVLDSRATSLRVKTATGF